MDFLTSDAFIIIVSVVGSVAGLLLALRADIGRRIDRFEERAKERDQALGQRIDRFEDRTRADHLKLVAEINELKTDVGAQINELKTAMATQIAELKAVVSAQIAKLTTAVSVVDAKLDERSAPQGLVVKEPPGEYAADDEPEGGPEP